MSASNVEFVDPRAAKSLECPICLNLIKDATVACRDMHTFCKTCLETAFSDKAACPLCRTTVVYKPLPGNDWLRDHRIDSAVGDLLIKCQQGCDSKICFKQIEEHHKVCPEVLEHCKDCKIDLPRKDMEQHMIEYKMTHQISQLNARMDGVCKQMDDIVATCNAFRNTQDVMLEHQHNIKRRVGNVLNELAGVQATTAVLSVRAVASRKRKETATDTQIVLAKKVGKHSENDGSVGTSNGIDCRNGGAPEHCMTDDSDPNYSPTSPLHSPTSPRSTPRPDYRSRLQSPVRRVPSPAYEQYHLFDDA